ncbi:unnamed protein product, partial [Symbiodinium sp. KB8]
AIRQRSEGSSARFLVGRYSRLTPVLKSARVLDLPPLLFLRRAGIAGPELSARSCESVWFTLGGKKWPRQQYDASSWQQPSQSQSWQLWKGTNSPNWNKRRSQGPDWLNMRYDQMQVAPVQAEAAETGDDELSSMGSLLVKDVQRALTAARKADQKSRRVKQDILTKREQCTTVAKETVARGCRPHEEAEDDSWDRLISAAPDMEVEPAGFYEEALAAEAMSFHRGPETVYTREDLDAGMARLQQMQFAASRLTCYNAFQDSQAEQPAEPDWVARQEVGDPNIVLPEPPPPFAERAVLAPFVAEASQAITEGGWLGVYIYAPNYHTQLGAVRIVPTASEQDVVDLVLSLTHEQWDHWPRRVAPASCQPTLGSATFLTFPAILDECGLRAIIVDLSQLDGSRFAISVKAGCQAPDLLQAADIEMPPQEVQLLIAGDPDPWQPDASLPLSHGDVVFVVPLAKTVHPGHSLGEVLSSPSTWEVATSLPSPYPTNGFLIHSEGFYWFADRSLYPGVSNDDIARRILGVDLPVSRLHIANSLRHHDLHGHECRGLMFVSEENDADVEGDAEPDVLVRNVFFDLRPLGFGLQIVRTYREVWTRAQIFGLLQLQEPAGWDIHIDGGGADSLHVQVMRNSVIMLYGTPISSSQAESVESESDHDEDVDLDSADERRSAASESEVHPPEVPERGRSRSPPPSSSRTLHREALACEDQLDALLLLHFSAIGVVIWYRVFARNIVYFLLLVCLCQPCRKNAPGRTPRDGLTGESCSAHADLAEVILAPVRGIVSPTALGTDDIPESPGVVLQGTAEAAATQGVLQSAPALEANFLVLRLGCRHTHIVLREPFFACNESIFCRLRLALAGAGEPTPLSGIPTTPQLGRRFASVVMVPTWVLSSLRRVIVFDFSQIGGPVYASLIWDPVTFSDLTVAASAQGLDNWAVFLDDTPHALDATFSRKVLNGTVFCFVRRGHSPDWGPVFDAELSNSQSWDCRPPESLLQPCRPSWLLLYEGVTRRLGHFGKPVVRLLDLAREHTYRRAVHLSFGCPLSADLADSFVHQGRGVCGLLAAVPRSEAIDPGARLGAFVFLDARLIDGDVAFRFVAPGWHSVEELAGPLNIRMPAGCCVAILDQGAARTSVFVRHGDSLQLGFMPLPHARLPSGVPGLPRFRYCRGADPPDLTVHRDGQIDLTHQQHLQLLFQPFGEGQVPDGAPPELDRQDPDEAADLEMAPPFIHAMFLVLTPDYAPDVVVVYLRAPCTVEDAFDEIEDVRDADRRRLF